MQDYALVPEFKPLCNATFFEQANFKPWAGAVELFTAVIFALS